MTALYWPDLDCTPESRLIADPRTVHDHHATERPACEAFLAWMAIAEERWHAGDRYRCIRGPGGLVRGVRR